MKLDKQRAMAELDVPEDFYLELVRDFLGQADAAVKRLGELAAAGGPFEEMAKIGHFLKGSAGNLRIQEIYEMAIELERAGLQGDRSVVVQKLGEIRGALAELHTQV